MSRLHIHAPPGIYVAQVRRLFERRWTTVGDEFKQRDEAQAAAAKGLVDEFRRARVLFCADYYDPVIVMEASR